MGETIHYELDIRYCNSYLRLKHSVNAFKHSKKSIEIVQIRHFRGLVSLKLGSVLKKILHCEKICFYFLIFMDEANFANFSKNNFRGNL